MTEFHQVKEQSNEKNTMSLSQHQFPLNVEFYVDQQLKKSYNV